MGDFRAQLREDLVPMTAQNFIDLTNDNFYDGLIFHRVISEFIADVKIEFSTDNGQSWSDIIESQSANTRTYTWPAPNVTSTECLVKISDVAHPDVFSVTSTPFTLCQLDLTNPTGFGYSRVGSPVEITWASELVGDLTLAYKASNIGDWITIDEGVAATNNSYTWIPEEVTSWCRVRITETAYPDVFDETENFFIVFQLDLTSPVGGDILDGNSQFEITWESEIISSVKIEFSSDNGQNWSTVVGSTSAGNSLYYWTVPNISSDECFVKITTPPLPDLYSINETPFSVDEVIGISDQPKKEEIGFVISPIPAADKVTVTFLNPVEWIGNTEVEIYNTKGELVYSQSLGRINYSGQTVSLDLIGLPQGMYLLRVEANGISETRKLLLVK